MKRFLLWSLLSAIAVDVLAFTEEVNGTMWYYTLTSAGAVIQNDGRSIQVGEYEVLSGGTYSGALVTPQKLGGDPVVGIEEWAFYNCTNLTSLTIGEGVAAIGDFAFFGSTSLTTVAVPTTVTSIGQSAFSGCPLATVNVGKGETARVSALLAGAGVPVAGILFVEPTILVTVVPGAKVSFSTADKDVFGKKLTKYAVSGLPAGLEYDKTKGTISGTVTKKSEVGEHLVTFTKGKDVKKLQIIVENVPKISVQMWGETEAATNGCKVTGAGSCLVGKKATLKVTMPKATKSSATIFLGWYKGDKPWPNKSTYKKTTVTYTMTEKYTDIRLEARFRVETAKQVSIAWSGVGAEGRAFVTGVAGSAAGMPVVVSSVDGSSLSGVESVTVTGLPAGMKYDAKKGCIVGAPTKANAKATVKVTVTTTAGVVKATSFKVTTTPMAEVAVGSFRGFVVKNAGDGVWEDIGTFSLTVKSDGRLSAKAETASKSVSFTGDCWDSITGDGVYCATLKSKDKKDKLTLRLDPAVSWDGDQLTGEFNSDGIAAQRQVLGMPWYFRCVSGDENAGWRLAYAESASKADLTVKLSAGGETQIAGTLKGKKSYKVSASGYANVSLMTNGVFIADFAPVLKVGGKKKVLSIHTRLWMDRSNGHQDDDVGIGDVKFAP